MNYGIFLLHLCNISRWIERMTACTPSPGQSAGASLNSANCQPGLPYSQSYPLRRPSTACKKQGICKSHISTYQAASLHLSILTLAFSGCKCLPPCGVEKALAEDVLQVLLLTYKTIAAVVVAVARFLWCSETWFAGLLSRSSLLYHHLPHDDLLLREILPFGAVPLFDGGDLGFGDVRFPRSGVSEALACTSHVVGAVP